MGHLGPAWVTFKGGGFFSRAPAARRQQIKSRSSWVDGKSGKERHGANSSRARVSVSVVCSLLARPGKGRTEAPPPRSANARPIACCGEGAARPSRSSVFSGMPAPIQRKAQMERNAGGKGKAPLPLASFLAAGGPGRPGFPELPGPLEMEGLLLGGRRTCGREVHKAPLGPPPPHQLRRSAVVSESRDRRVALRAALACPRRRPPLALLCLLREGQRFSGGKLSLPPVAPAALRRIWSPVRRPRAPQGRADPGRPAARRVPLRKGRRAARHGKARPNSAQRPIQRALQAELDAPRKAPFREPRVNPTPKHPASAQTRRGMDASWPRESPVLTGKFRSL